MDDYQRKMRDELTKGIAEAEDDLKQNLDWGRWWAFVGSLQSMTKAGAYATMLALSRGVGYAENREEYLNMARANIKLDPKTADRYIRTIGLYEREDFQELDEPVLEQLQALPVQWQVRLMQSLGEEKLTNDILNDVLSSESFEQFNERLRLRKGGTPRTGNTYSINPTGEVYAYWNGEMIQGGPVCVWTGRTDSREYADFLKRMGIRS